MVLSKISPPNKMKDETKQKAFLNAATEIGIQLCRDAVWEKDRCNWITFDKGTSAQQKEFPYFRTLKGEFYGGTSGIATFLVCLFKATGNPLFRKTATGALDQALSICESQKEHPGILLGFHTGWTGLAYASILMGRMLDEEQYVENGLKLIGELYGFDISKFGLDVIDGCAGAIPVLIKIYREYDHEPLLHFINRLGQHLINVAKEEPFGWSWDTVSMTDQNLTGFAHGVAGIIHAFFELYQLTSDEKYLNAAQQGANYERHFFNEQEQNWPDFRKFEGQDQQLNYPCLWCHGAAGIGLSRVRAFEITENPAMKKEASIAVQTTLKQTSFRHGFGASLCHGVFGNADLLLLAGHSFQDQKLIERAQELGMQGIENFQKKDIPWVNGLHNTYQIPGFMLGLAGIGYFYLRLYDAERFPSLLLNRGIDNF